MRTILAPRPVAHLATTMWRVIATQFGILDAPAETTVLIGYLSTHVLTRRAAPTSLTWNENEYRYIYLFNEINSSKEQIDNIAALT